MFASATLSLRYPNYFEGPRAYKVASRDRIRPVLQIDKRGLTSFARRFLWTLNVTRGNQKYWTSYAQSTRDGRTEAHHVPSRISHGNANMQVKYHRSAYSKSAFYRWPDSKSNIIPAELDRIETRATIGFVSYSKSSYSTTDFSREQSQINLLQFVFQ